MKRVRRHLYWLKKCARPGDIAFLMRLRRNEGMSSDAMAQLNWNKRKALLRHAYETVPYYRKKWSKEGLCPNDIKDDADFSRIPPITKEEIRESTDEIVSTPVAGTKVLVESTTGGSTGVPLRVYHDRRFPSHVVSWRTWAWWNVSYGDDQATVYRFPRNFDPERCYPNGFTGWPVKRIYLDASSIDGTRMNEFLEQYQHVKPAVLGGYVGGVEALAQHIEKTGITVHSPEAVWLTSSPATPSLRALTERVFECPTYDFYGSCEVFHLASECAMREGLHVNSDIRHIEIVNSNGLTSKPGVSGEIHVTDLENYAFPIIRYANGDAGSWVGKECSCGRPFPLLRPVKGRISDNIFLPGGKTIAGEFLTTVFDDFPEAVRQFQIYQKTDHSILVSVVPSSEAGLDQSIREHIDRTLKTKTEGLVRVNIITTDIIPSDRGKNRYIISDLKA